MKGKRDYPKYLPVLLCSLLFARPAWGQDEAFKNIQHVFEQYSRAAAAEKIYLHTDKNAYLAGEIAWFKVYNADAGTHLPATESKVAYVEIIDKDRKPVLQAKVGLTGKGGSGSFYLPLSLVTGHYVLRAYTSSMKNEGAPVFFEKLVSIVNTIKPGEVRAARDTTRVNAGFFPEGGHLVAGIDTRLAFHITDQYGRGLAANGIILNQLGDTVHSFSTRRFGMGSFNFSPLAGQHYRAILDLSKGKILVKNLPPVHEFGYVMNVSDQPDGRLKLRIRAKTIDPGKRGENVLLLGHSRQVIRVAEKGFINYESDLVFLVDKTTLAEGITHFTLFNADQQPVCERLVFLKPGVKSIIQIATDKNRYQTRQQVTLTVSNVNDGNFSGADYSIAVLKKEEEVSVEEDDLASYLLLTSDLTGTVESPAYYFSAAADVHEATDELMLTRGWRRFKWNNLLPRRPAAKTKFPTERKGHVITARIVRLADQQPAAHVDCFLSGPGTPFGFYTTRSDENGLVQFNVERFYGPGEIIIQAGKDTISRYRADVLTAFSDETYIIQPPPLVPAREREAEIAARSIAMQAQNIYVPDSIRRFVAPQFNDTLPFFWNT